MQFCIVGTGRCGTTLLWQMLNSHPDLFVYRETHWIPALYENFGTRRGPVDAMLDLVLRTKFVGGARVTDFDPDEFRRSPYFAAEATVRDFCESLAAFFCQKQGKTRWADKTPDYGYFASVLQLYWPDCKIIHLIRDGVPTARSMSRHIGYQALASLDRMHWPPLALDFAPPECGFPPSPASRYADLWRDRLLRTRDEAQRLSPGSYLELRYENLTEIPGEQLRTIARFVGLAEDSEWLLTASKMVDPGRASARAPAAIPDYFADSHRALLDALGYHAKQS